MLQSETIKEIAPAFIQAQAKIEGAIKNAKNGHLGNNYADLSAVIEACRKHLADHDLAVLQTTDCAEDQSYVAIETTLLHKSGEWFRSVLKMPLEKRNAHGVGSAMTYGRRYALAAMVGIAQVDDDAEGSIHRGQQQQQKKVAESAKINEAQLADIMALGEEVGANMASFCKFLKVDRLADLPAADYNRAIKALESKRKPQEQANV